MPGGAAGFAGCDWDMMGLVVASSARVRVVGQLVMKIKYCHPIFGLYPEVKKRCEEILREVLARNSVPVEAVGFDSNHVHFLLNAGLNCLPELVKELKGETGRKLLEEFPEVKRKWFWGSGFWNPSWYFDCGGDFGRVKQYVLDQPLSKREREAQAVREVKTQRLLSDF